MGLDTIELSRRIRASALKMVSRANASHIGSALSITDIVAVLYGSILNYDINDPEFDGRDRFILSKGHACVAVYAALAEIGYITRQELETYGQDFSWLMNHISHKVKGVEFSTGALGHGLPFGVGKALAAKKTCKSWHTYVVMSDGELDEGSNWEAMLFAAHHQLDNLTAIIDYNKLQSLTTVQETLSLEPLADKLKAFGLSVVETDGHDHKALSEAFHFACSKKGKPVAIIAHTIKGRGISFMENKVEWHYKAPSTEQLQSALKELGYA